MINEKGMKGDDVQRGFNGERVEVVNRDGEGGVVLGDGVGFGREFKGEVILDFGRLRGAGIVGLGEDKVGVFE